MHAAFGLEDEEPNEKEKPSVQKQRAVVENVPWLLALSFEAVERNRLGGRQPDLVACVLMKLAEQVQFAEKKK